MKFKMNAVSRGFFLFTILWLIACFAVACTTTWVTEATQIIQLIVPAITSALGILSAFGVGMPADALATVQSWANQCTSGLQQVGDLITQYNTAEATAQPGLLQEIDTAMQAVVADFGQILPLIHVTDPSTQAKITAVANAILAEMQALMNVIPAIQGKVSLDEAKKLIAAVQSPKEFKANFNTLVATFGKAYEI